MKFFHKSNKMLLRNIINFKLKFVPKSTVLGFRFAHIQTPFDHKHKKYVDHRKYAPDLQMVSLGFDLNENACEYPPIFDTSEEGLKKHNRQIWYDYIKALPSVEEKLFELAVQQKMELKKYKLESVPTTFNSINFQNYITRTHIVKNLPETFLNMNVDLELDEIKDTLNEVLVNYYCDFWRENKFKKLSDYFVEPNAGSNLVNSLISQCFKKLARRNDYVLNSTIQQKPRIFSFWWHGGFGTEEAEVDEKNLCFQFEDYAAFAIRGSQPLLPILDINHELCSTAEVENFNYHPEVFQIPCETIPKVASIPAYWPGDPHEYPFLLVLTSENLKNLTSELEFYDLSKVEDGTAIISSFAWLTAVASYQGFSPFHDLTYPLVTHTIVTNGQDWNFYIYQLNTFAFHNDVDRKDRRNLCWSSGKLRLFDTIENGQVKGVNEEVFKMLLKTLHNTPMAREGLDMKPYLGTDTRNVDEIVYTRQLLRKYYSRVYEKMENKNFVPTWVQIYKNHPDAPPSPCIKLQ